MRVVLGDVDTYLSPGLCCKFWDLCAPEAILRAMGGVMTGIKKENYLYSEDKCGGQPKI